MKHEIPKPKFIIILLDEENLSRCPFLFFVSFVIIYSYKYTHMYVHTYDM